MVGNFQCSVGRSVTLHSTDSCGNTTNLSRKSNDDVMSRWKKPVFAEARGNFDCRGWCKKDSMMSKEKWSQVILKFWMCSVVRKWRKRFWRVVVSCCISWNISTGKWENFNGEISLWIDEGGRALFSTGEDRSLLVNKLFWQGKMLGTHRIGKWDEILDCQLFSDILLSFLLFFPKTTTTLERETPRKGNWEKSWCLFFKLVSHSMNVASHPLRKDPKPSKVMSEEKEKKYFFFPLTIYFLWAVAAMEWEVLKRKVSSSLHSALSFSSPFFLSL